MNKFMSTVLGLLLVAGVTAAACGGGDDAVDIPGVDDGDISRGLVDGFPDDFPVYPDSDLQGSYRGEDAGQEGIAATWTTGDSLDEVSAFFDEELADFPWKSISKSSAAGVNSWQAQNEDESKFANVSVSSAEGETAILVIVADNNDGSTDGADDGNDEPTADSGDGDSGNGDDGDTGAPPAQLPDEVDIDDDYPSDDVPLPSGARVTSSSSFGQGGTNTFFIEFYTQDSVDEVASYFESELTGNGWTQSLTSTTNGEVFASYARSDDPETTTDNGVILTVRESEVEGYTQATLSVSVVGG